MRSWPNIPMPPTNHWNSPSGYRRRSPTNCTVCVRYPTTNGWRRGSSVTAGSGCDDAAVRAQSGGGADDLDGHDRGVAGEGFSLRPARSDGRAFGRSALLPGGGCRGGGGRRRRPRPGRGDRTQRRGRTAARDRRGGRRPDTRRGVRRRDVAPTRTQLVRHRSTDAGRTPSRPGRSRSASAVPRMVSGRRSGGADTRPDTPAAPGLGNSGVAAGVLRRAGPAHTVRGIGDLRVSAPRAALRRGGRQGPTARLVGGPPRLGPPANAQRPGRGRRTRRAGDTTDRAVT